MAVKLCFSLTVNNVIDVLFQSVLQEVKKAYKEGTQKDVLLAVDEEDFLPAEG